MALYQCSICQEKFYSPILVQRHQESEHPDQEGAVITLNYQCPVCRLSFGHPDSVKNHALLNHGLLKPEAVEIPV